MSKYFKNLMGAASILLITNTSFAGEWIVAPYKDPNWSADFTLAVQSGKMDPGSNLGDDDDMTGLQLSLNCPWFTPPSGNIRQQFNYNKFDNNAIEVTTFEMNPRYYVGEGKVTYGIGPGIGYMWAKPNGGEETTMFTYQLGADVEYRNGAFYAGVSVRRMFTQDDNIKGTTVDGLDNTLTAVKLGVNF